MAETNPFKAGVFYSGAFIDDQFIQTFSELFADERLAVFVSISAKPDTSVLAMRHTYVEFTLNDLRPSYAFYFVNSSGIVVVTGNIPAFPNRTIRFETASIPPSVLVLVDENDDFRYITVNPSTLALVASGTKPALREDTFQYFGPYIDMVGQNGQSIYRISCNSSNVISNGVLRVEPQRIMPLYISSGHKRPYKDGHLYLGYLESLGDIDTSVEQSEGRLGGVSVPRLGVLTVNLGDGHFDYLTRQSWDARNVEISVGLTTTPFPEYKVILRTKTNRIEWDYDHLKITMIDHSILFDRSIQTNSYAGTGGFEGTAEIKGVLKPLAIGQVRNATPVLVNKNLNLYQIHDGAMYPSTLVIREGGSAHFTNVTNRELLTWNPTPGDVSNAFAQIDGARGMFRLSAPPEGRITCSFIGTTSIPQTSTLSDIISYIIRRSTPEISIDSNVFDFHKTHLAQPYGVYIDEQRTVGDVINEFCQPTGELLALTRLSIARLIHLSRGPARAFIVDSSIAENSSFNRRNPPTPGAKYRLGYNRTSTVFTETDFLGSISIPTDTDGHNIKHVMQNEYLWNELHMSGSGHPGLDRYDSAKSIDIPTNMRFPHNDLLTEVALRDHSLLDLFDITVVGFSFFFELGDTVLVQLDRWGMHVPKTMIILGITEISPSGSGEDQTRLILWG